MHDGFGCSTACLTASPQGCALGGGIPLRNPRSQTVLTSMKACEIRERLRRCSPLDRPTPASSIAFYLMLTPHDAYLKPRRAAVNASTVGKCRLAMHTPFSSAQPCGLAVKQAVGPPATGELPLGRRWSAPVGH